LAKQIKLNAARTFARENLEGKTTRQGISASIVSKADRQQIIEKPIERKSSSTLRTSSLFSKSQALPLKDLRKKNRCNPRKSTKNAENTWESHKPKNKK
jgi:hypothetical protein